MSAAKKARVVPGYKPWAAVTLNVDGGEHCGVSVYDSGTYFDSGHGDGYDPAWIDEWIVRGVMHAEAMELPLVLVLEKPPAGGRPYKGTKRAPAGAASVTGSCKLWRRRWRRNPDTVTKRLVEVYPPTWRGAVLGSLIDPQPRERLRAAIEKWGNAAKQDKMEQNESAAICIGIWSSNAGEVAKALPQKLRLAR